MQLDLHPAQFVHHELRTSIQQQALSTSPWTDAQAEMLHPVPSIPVGIARLKTSRNVPFTAVSLILGEESLGNLY